MSRLVRSLAVVQAASRQGNPFAKLHSEKQKSLEKPAQVIRTPIIEQLSGILESAFELENQGKYDEIEVFVVQEFELRKLSPSQREIEEFLMSVPLQRIRAIDNALSCVVDRCIQSSKDHNIYLDFTRYGISSISVCGIADKVLEMHAKTFAECGYAQTGGSLLIVARSVSYIGRSMSGGTISLSLSGAADLKIVGQRSTGGTISFTCSESIEACIRRIVDEDHATIGATIIVNGKQIWPEGGSST